MIATKADMPEARIRSVVPFHDCDPLQVVWHGRYLEYFELARTELFAKARLDVPHFRELGHKMYVSDVRCRFMYPLSYGDEFEVTARPTVLRPLLRVAYSIRNRTQGRQSARGYTVLAVTDVEGRLLPETPEIIVERLVEAAQHE